MRPERSPRARSSRGVVWIATVLLVGVALMGFGYFEARIIPLYAGLFVTFAGVLIGVVRLVTRGAI